MAPNVDVIMTTWNGVEFTKRTIESFKTHVKAPYRLICVDNGSGDETVEFLRSVADLVIANSTNVGPIRARNQGYAVSSADLVLFIDNDIEFACDVVERLTAALEQDPRLGIVGPVLNQHLEEMKFAVAGATVAEITGALGQLGPGALQDVTHTPCCMLIRRAVVDEVGWWDTVYEIYGYEEYDYCKRAKARGWRVALALACYVHHNAQRASDRLADRDALVERNRQTFFRRWGVTVKDGTTGIVEPYPVLAETAPAASRLATHLATLGWSGVAACRPDPSWPAVTERFVDGLPHTGPDVLVIGCGSSEAVKQLRHRYSRRAVGLVPALGPDNVYGVRQGFGYDLPFEDASFDAVIARHSLEHSPMPLVNLLEAHRVLRPSGLAIVSVPNPGPGVGNRSVLHAELTDRQWQRLFSLSSLALLDARADPDDANKLRYVLRKTP